MYKKVFTVWLVALWLLSSIVINRWYAEEYTQDDLKDIVVRFCDKIGDLDLKKTVYAEPGKENKVSFCIYNNSTKKLPVTYGFMTAGYNWVWTRVCQSNTDTENHEFTLIPKTKDRTVFLESWETKMIEEAIVIPPGMNTWIQMWCMTAEIGWDASAIDMWSMFVLKVRKAFDLDIVLWWVAAIESNIKLLNTTWGVYSTNKQFKAEVDDENNLKLTFLVANNGNIGQNITITGKVYNALGFEKEFSANSQIIVPKATNEITADVWLLPGYKWLLSVKYYMQNDPQFTFDVDQNLKKSWYISGTAKIFIFSRVRVIALIVLIFILYRVFVPKKTKVIEVQVPSMQPVPSAPLQ